MLSVDQMLATLEREGLAGRFEGRGDIVCDHLRSTEQADSNSLTFYVGTSEEMTLTLRNCVIICSEELALSNPNVGYLVTEDPRLAFYVLAQAFRPTRPDPGIHESAVVHPDAQVDPSASIGPFCVIGECVVEGGVQVHSHVVLYDRTRVRQGATIESNSSIGATGQVWAWGRDGKRWELPQVGGTEIGEGCFIGSTVTIVRAALEDTVIKRGARIAHGTKIGHNCCIGEDTFVSNGVAIPGSVTIGDRCFLGSGTSYRSGIAIGNDVVVGAGAVVVRSFEEDGIVLAGVPAEIKKHLSGSARLAGVPSRPT
jgi:UDP-3-O-[3-hydroxymyristoyl] glucosamine N-acyltransferase